eukprot:COSAG02_NODE_1895_length_10468_cov_4.296268_2_plen_114_part_00
MGAHCACLGMRVISILARNLAVMELSARLGARVLTSESEGPPKVPIGGEKTHPTELTLFFRVGLLPLFITICADFLQSTVSENCMFSGYSSGFIVSEDLLVRIVGGILREMCH